MEFLRELVHWTLGWADSPYGAVGLFGIAFAESSFFPIPPDLLQIALSVLNPQKSFFYAFIALAGSVSGAALGYLIGLYGGRPLLNKFMSHEKIEFAEKLFKKYDVWAIGIAGFTPVPYKVFAVSGGVFGIDFKRFILVSILSRGARFFIIAGAIHLLGEKVKDVLLKHVNVFSLLFVVALVGGFLVIHFFSGRLKK